MSCDVSGKRGFGEFFGFLGGARSYDPRNNPGDPIRRTSGPVDEKEYLTDAFTREAVAFIDRHKARPWFLYLAFNAPHTLYQATQEYLDPYKHIADPSRRAYAAMISAMDAQIGRVVAALDAKGLRDNTLVVFFSDNGGQISNDRYPGVEEAKMPVLVPWR